MPAKDSVQRVPALHWWVLILFGLGLNGFLAYYPSPSLLFNPFPWLDDATSRSVIQRIFQAAIFVHVLEGGYAYSLALRTEPSRSLFWGVQTFILGFPSLRLLKAIARQKTA